MVRLVLAASMLVACSGDNAPDAGASEARCEALAERAGEATYYAADGSGNCSFEPTAARPLFVVALNDADYDHAGLCGACVRVQGPLGSAVVRVVDRCPGCGPGDIDLSTDAFERIANPADGRVPVTWQPVACGPNEPIRLRFKDGSSPWWTAIQVDGHRHAIASLAYRESMSAQRILEVSPRDVLAQLDAWVEMRRELYNYFVADSGVGEGPIDVRITDIHGHSLVAGSIAPGDGVDIDTGLQLPRCGP
jgi:expansin